MASTRNGNDHRRDAEVVRVVKRVVAERARRGLFERVHRDELVTDVLARVVRTVNKLPDANLEAVARWHVRKAVTDLWRTRVIKIEQQNIAIQRVDIRPPRKRSAPVSFRDPESRESVLEEKLVLFLTSYFLSEDEKQAMAHTSFIAIQREQARVLRQITRVTLALLQRPEDAEMFHLRFVAAGHQPTLQQLADRSGLSVASVHNRLEGGLELLRFVADHFRMLDTGILENLAERLENTPPRPLALEELVRAATNYARMQAELSTAHAEVATNIAEHMKWIGANLPPRRKGMASVLRALVDGASRYVLDKDDAQHDMFAVRGLHDDRKVARQVRLAIRDWMKESSLT
ncbi:MAG: hypothetical protein ACKOFF_07910 [Acidimicrobiales bacterium]